MTIKSILSFNGWMIFMYKNIFKGSVSLCVVADAFTFGIANYFTPLHIALVQIDQMIMDEYMDDHV